MLLRNAGRRVCPVIRSTQYYKSTLTPEEVVESCKKHTFWSWSAQKAVNPITMVRGEGIHFWDAHGKKYVDLNSQLMCSNIGHGHKKVIQAMQQQAEELAYAGPSMATHIRAEFGPLLAKHTPGDLNKFFFTLGGAEANENAIKMAKQYTGRHKILTRYRSYHGATHGAIILTGDPRRWPNEPGMGGVIRTFDPCKYRSPLYQEGMTDLEFSKKMLAQLEETLMYENPHSFAAVVIETVTGTNGLIVPPDGYLAGLREICDKYGILLICDEVMAGLGRTGEWFAVDNWKVVPDMITMAKGLTSAYMPLGCVAVCDKVAHYFDEKVLSGGLTYNGHPMSLAAAVATLRVLEEEKIVENSKAMGKVMSKLMHELQDKHPCVGDVRSIGLFGGFEIVTNRKTKKPLVPFNGSHPTMVKLMGFLRERGIYAFNGGTVLFSNPPLIINEQQLREVYAILDEALNIADAEVTSD